MDTYVTCTYRIGFYLSQQVSCKYLRIMNRLQTNHEVLGKGKLMMITMIARWYMLFIQWVIEFNAVIISRRTFGHIIKELLPHFIEIRISPHTYNRMDIFRFEMCWMWASTCGIKTLTCILSTSSHRAISQWVYIAFFPGRKQFARLWSV